MDKVRLIPLERAELEDTLALQTLVYEHLERHTGQLLGAGDVAGGLLSAPSPSFNSVTGDLRFQSFAFVALDVGEDATDGSARTPTARVIRFDSAALGHVGYPVDASAFTQGVKYDLYVRAIDVQSDSAQRQQFSVATGLEVAITMNTRERERVEFRALSSGAASPSGDGWVKIGGVTRNNGTITFEPISLWDDANDKAVARLESRIPQIVADTSDLIDGIARDNSQTLGLIEMLSLIRTQLARVLHYGRENDDPIAADTPNRWTDRPEISLARLATRTSALTTDLATETEARQDQRIYHIYARLYFKWTSSENSLHHTLYDETELARLDFDPISTIEEFGDPTLTSADFLTRSRFPVIQLDSNPAGGEWRVMSHSIQPVIQGVGTSGGAVGIPLDDSLANGTFNAMEPRDFRYAVMASNSELRNDSPNDDAQGRDTTTLTAPEIMLARRDNRIKFNIAMDAVTVGGGNYFFTYDIMLSLKKVATT